MNITMTFALALDLTCINSWEFSEDCTSAWRLRGLLQVTQHIKALWELALKIQAPHPKPLHTYKPCAGVGVWGTAEPTGNGGWGQQHLEEGKGFLVAISVPSSWNVPSQQEALPGFLIKRRCCLEGGRAPWETKLCYQVLLLPVKELTVEKFPPLQFCTEPLHPTSLQLDSLRRGLWWGEEVGGRALCRGKGWVVSKIWSLSAPGTRKAQ